MPRSAGFWSDIFISLYACGEIHVVHHHHAQAALEPQYLDLVPYVERGNLLVEQQAVAALRASRATRATVHRPIDCPRLGPRRRRRPSHTAPRRPSRDRRRTDPARHATGTAEDCSSSVVSSSPSKSRCPGSDAWRPPRRAQPQTSLRQRVPRRHSASRSAVRCLGNQV